jgi:hypothetical protein
MKYRGIFEYEYPTEHKPPISIDVHLHGDCVNGKIIEWEYRPLEQEPRWIPVSERLPNSEYGESDSVLVCFENETQDVLYFDGSNWCYPTGETYISVNHKNGWHNRVIAWMPLPQAYREVEE